MHFLLVRLEGPCPQARRPGSGHHSVGAGLRPGWVDDSSPSIVPGLSKSPATQCVWAWNLQVQSLVESPGSAGLCVAPGAPHLEQVLFQQLGAP